MQNLVQPTCSLSTMISHLVFYLALWSFLRDWHACTYQTGQRNIVWYLKFSVVYAWAWSWLKLERFYESTYIHHSAELQVHLFNAQVMHCLIAFTDSPYISPPPFLLSSLTEVYTLMSTRWLRVITRVHVHTIHVHTTESIVLKGLHKSWWKSNARDINMGCWFQDY